MFDQKTPKCEVRFEGRGLHTGRPVMTRILPASPNSGIVFVRTDQDGRAVPARQEYLEASRLSTSLSRNGIRVATVEHLLAVLWALGVDNARVEVDGPEVPILDGSAAPFAEALGEVGLKRQNAPGRFLTMLQPISVAEGEKRLAIFPANDLTAAYAIDFSQPVIGYQEKAFRLSPHAFAEELAPARTFCLVQDVEAMRRQGLALGGSLSNAVVVGDDGILNGPLRFPDEFVRHKLLDLIGDLALLGDLLLMARRCPKSSLGKSCRSPCWRSASWRRAMRVPRRSPACPSRSTPGIIRLPFASSPPSTKRS